MMVVTHGNCPFWQERKKDDARPWSGHCNSPKDCGVSMKGVRPGFNGVGNYVIVPAYTHIGLPTREDPKKTTASTIEFHASKEDCIPCAADRKSPVLSASFPHFPAC